MLRVCGITYVHTTNYGSCFQAYALQMAIDGITVGGEKCQHEFVPLWLCSDHFTNKSDNNIFYKVFLRQFKSFQEEKIRYNACRQVRDLPLLNESCDAFVCGSDVIWHPQFNHQLGLYYLDFAKKYKFSYAASFGRSDNENVFLQTAGKWIAELSEVSVREQSSVEIVKRYSDRDAKVVADPVILLTQEEWYRIAGAQKGKNKYIFSYTTHNTPEYEKVLKKLSEVTGLRVVKAAWHKSMKEALKQGILKIQSPETWLRQLRDAEYVVTNSFHATVFSSIFHKKFFTVVHGEKNEGSNFRMYDYLKSIGLQDRMYSSVPETIDLSEINFEQSDIMIEKMRADGLRYLQENLEAAYAQKMQREH